MSLSTPCSAQSGLGLCDATTLSSSEFLEHYMKFSVSTDCGCYLLTLQLEHKKCLFNEGPIHLGPF